MVDQNEKVSVELKDALNLYEIHKGCSDYEHCNDPEQGRYRLEHDGRMSAVITHACQRIRGLAFLVKPLLAADKQIADCDAQIAELRTQIVLGPEELRGWDAFARYGAHDRDCSQKLGADGCCPCGFSDVVIEANRAAEMVGIAASNQSLREQIAAGRAEWTKGREQRDLRIEELYQETVRQGAQIATVTGQLATARRGAALSGIADSDRYDGHWASARAALAELLAPKETVNA